MLRLLDAAFVIHKLGDSYVITSIVTAFMDNLRAQR
jgi:hypothetical protein